MIRLEKRRSISKFWTTVTPVIAVFLTMSFGGLMFGLLLGDFSSATCRLSWCEVASAKVLTMMRRPALLEGAFFLFLLGRFVRGCL